MDQGVAAVWAAAVAGVASAGGAALGAALTTRGTGVVALRQSELDKRHRDDEFRRQSCLAFQSKLGEAVAALDEAIHALRQGQSTTDAKDQLRRAIGVVHRGHFDHVVVCGTKELIDLSDSALQWLAQSARALDALYREPVQAADPASPLVQNWDTVRQRLLIAYEMFSKALPRFLTP